jgi:hypothetical protein
MEEWIARFEVLSALLLKVQSGLTVIFSGTAL